MTQPERSLTDLIQQEVDKIAASKQQKEAADLAARLELQEKLRRQAEQVRREQQAATNRLFRPVNELLEKVVKGAKTEEFYKALHQEDFPVGYFTDGFGSIIKSHPVRLEIKKDQKYHSYEEKFTKKGFFLKRVETRIITSTTSIIHLGRLYPDLKKGTPAYGEFRSDGHGTPSRYIYEFQPFVSIFATIDSQEGKSISTGRGAIYHYDPPWQNRQEGRIDYEFNPDRVNITEEFPVSLAKSFAISYHEFDDAWKNLQRRRALEELAGRF